MLSVKVGKLSEMPTDEILNLYAMILIELKKRNITRTSNNPVADYAERIVADKLSLKLMPNSHSGYDAVGDNNLRYQIKARRKTRQNSSKLPSVFRNLEQRDFDYLVGILFQEDFSLDKAYLIPYETVKKYAGYSEHRHGHILHLKGEILLDKNTQEITDLFNNFQTTIGTKEPDKNTKKTLE